MEKENKMAVMPMPKLVITMSLPLMLSLLIQSLYNIVDSIFVAKLSEEALTATSLVFPMQLLMIAEYSIQYLSICMICCIGSLVSTMFQRFLQAVGDTFYSMLSLIAGAVTNIILDPILIFGLFGLPALGVRGAAIATVIGQCVSAAAAIWLNSVKNPVVKINLKNYKMNGNVVAQIYKVGLPTIITQAIGSIMVAAINAILMPFSSTAVAFFGVYYKLQNFLFMPMNGLGQAAIPIIGFSYGSKNFGRIREAIRTIIPIAIGISFAAAVIFMVFPASLLGLFSPGSEMLMIGVPALRIISVTLIMASVTMVLGYSMSGLGNGMVNMFGTALRQLILFVPLAYLFASRFGIGKVWYSMWISEAAALVYAVYASGKEMRKRKIPGFLSFNNNLPLN